VKTSNGHISATRHPIDFVFGSRLGFFRKDRLALFNLAAHELHELYYYDTGLPLREALDRPCVRLNMYLVVIITARCYAVVARGDATASCLPPCDVQV